MSSLINQVIADSFIIKTKEDGEELDRRSWRLGQRVKTVYIIVQLTKSKIVDNPSQFSDQFASRFLTLGVWDCVAFVAELSGASVTTIKRFYDLVEFYTLDQRKQYKVLPMSHFEWAMSFPGFTLQILDIDLKLLDKNLGKPVPLNVLKALFNSIDRVPEVLDQLEQINTMDDVLALVETSQQSEDDDLPPLVYHFFENLTKVERYIERAVNLWHIPPEKRQQIISLVNQLAALVRETREISQKPVDKEQV